MVRLVMCAGVFVNSGCGLTTTKPAAAKRMWLEYRDRSVYVRPDYVVASFSQYGCAHSTMLTWDAFDLRMKDQCKNDPVDTGWMIPTWESFEKASA